jgi:hypothetical protein
MHSIQRPRRAAIVAAFAALAMAAAACTVPPTTPTPAAGAVRLDLVDQGFVASWSPTTAGQTDGYEVQYRTDTGDWTPAYQGFDTSTTVTGLTEGTRYTFRVRARTAPGGVPATWSSGTIGWYVVPELPVIRIDTQDAAPIVDRDNYVRATMTLDPNGSGYAPYTGTLGIKGRGNSTWNFPKKPYRLKLDSKSPMMGIASSKDWVLLANWYDKSQVRTSTAEAIAKSTDLAWTPTYRHVEVVLNGQYIGVYQFTEAIKPASTRIDIPELEEEDNSLPELSGGYLLEIDERLEENNEPGFRTTRNVPVVVKEPDPTTTAQRNYIRAAVQDLENSMFGPNFADPVTGYQRRLDVSSFIDQYLVQEITRNGDAFWSSTYFYKDRDDDRFYFGPIWDFDRSMGSTVTPRPQPPEGWYARTRGPWVNRLFVDPAFAARVDARFAELLPTLLELPEQIEELGESLEPAIDNDAVRWGYSVGQSDEPEYLEDWLEDRLDWMTENSGVPAT